jgi:hypothetical protein
MFTVVRLSAYGHASASMPARPFDSEDFVSDPRNSSVLSRLAGRSNQSRGQGAAALAASSLR